MCRTLLIQPFIPDCSGARKRKHGAEIDSELFTMSKKIRGTSEENSIADNPDSDTDDELDWFVLSPPPNCEQLSLIFLGLSPFIMVWTGVTLILTRWMP